MSSVMDQSQAPARRLDVPRGDERLLWDLHASEHYLLWLAAADEMGLFSLLDAAPATADETAAALKIGVVVAEGLLGVMAALGFLIAYDRRFNLTQTARDFLLPASPYYRGPWLEVVRRRPRVTYDMVYAALREDRSTHPDYWNPAEIDATRAADQVRGVQAFTLAGASGLAELEEFDLVRRLLDVGGGAGGMSIALALRHPDLHCTVLDHPIACSVAAEYSGAYGLDGRVDTIAGDALTDSWPTGYDAILLSHVLDCFGAPQCQALLHKAYDCLPSGGRLYIHEMILNDAKTGPLGVVAMSLYDHLGSRGQQWTAGELKAMLVVTGFVRVIVTPLHGYNALISAAKP